MRRVMWQAAFVCFVALLGIGVVRAETVFGVAGIPKALGQSRDYDRIFALLKSGGVDAFFPMFQYVEQPAPQTLGFETDFLPPCAAQSPAFAALRRHGIGLVVSADLIYPLGQTLPALDGDPLRALIACAGRETIYGVLSYDEPVHQGVTEAQVEQVFRRVKAVDPTLPVMMVHAPLIVDQAPYATEAARRRYLQAVLRFSRFADMVGFDVYPIPRDIAKVTAPDSNGAVLGHAAAIRGYTAWLKREMPDRRLMMVLQGFSYVDQFEPDFLARIAGPATIAAIAAPTATEIAEMTRLSVEGGAEAVFWWGPSLVRDVGDKPWPEMMGVIRSLKAVR